MDNIDLGDLAKDIVSGFTGVVMARTVWLMGCDRIQLVPRELKDGKPVEPDWFDVRQLQVLQKGIFQEEAEKPLATKDERGGPRKDPTNKMEVK